MIGRVVPPPNAARIHDMGQSFSPKHPEDPFRSGVKYLVAAENFTVATEVYVAKVALWLRSSKNGH